MQFNSHSSGLDIISDITWWTGANITIYPINDRTRHANLALDKAIALILQSDSKWKWDDSNHSDLPIGVAKINSGQQNYGIAGITFLTINEVQILNNAGTYDTLTAVLEDSQEGKDIMRKKNTGTPKYYLKKGDSIFLGPTPSSDLTNGLRVFFQRNVSYFTTSDTTKVPGFAQPFHRLISLYPSLDYLEVEEKWNRAKVVQKRITEMEAALVAFYSSRAKDEQPKIQLKKEDYGARGLTRGEEFGMSTEGWS